MWAAIIDSGFCSNLHHITVNRQMVLLFLPDSCHLSICPLQKYLTNLVKKNTHSSGAAVGLCALWADVLVFSVLN